MIPRRGAAARSVARRTEWLNSVWTVRPSREKGKRAACPPHNPRGAWVAYQLQARPEMAAPSPAELFPLINSFLESAGLHKAAKALAAETKNWKDGSKARAWLASRGSTRRARTGRVLFSSSPLSSPAAATDPPPAIGDAGSRRSEAGSGRQHYGDLFSLPDDARVRFHSNRTMVPARSQPPLRLADSSRPRAVL